MRVVRCCDANGYEMEYGLHFDGFLYADFSLTNDFSGGGKRLAGDDATQNDSYI